MALHDISGYNVLDSDVSTSEMIADEMKVRTWRVMSQDLKRNLKNLIINRMGLRWHFIWTARHFLYKLWIQTLTINHFINYVLFYISLYNFKPLGNIISGTGYKIILSRKIVSTVCVNVLYEMSTENILTSIHSQTPKMSILRHILFHASALHEVCHLVPPW